MKMICGRYVRAGLVGFAIAIVTVLVPGSSSEIARAAGVQLCTPQVTGLPASNGSGGFNFPDNPPNIIQSGSITGQSCSPNCSGDPAQDTGWFHAFRYRLENGTPAPDGAFQAIQQGSMLYLSFQIVNTPVLDQNDYIVLGFDNHAGRYTWIAINPFASFGSAGSNANIAPSNISNGLGGFNVIQAWTANGSLNANHQPPWSGAPDVNPSWIIAGTAATYSPGASGWYVVIGINIADPAGPLLTASPQFGVYLAAIRSDGNSPSNTDVAEQFTFPSQSYINQTNADTGTANPVPSTWATGTLSAGSCTGIFISNSDITNSVGGSQTQGISWTQANTFQVKVHNSGVDAPGVTATFKIANFGLPAPAEWLPLGENMFCWGTADFSTSPPTFPPGCTGASPAHPKDSVGNNPSTTGTDIPAFTTPPGTCPEANGDGCKPITAGSWTLGPDNVSYYSQPSNLHECVRVDLDSVAGNTSFLNNSSWNNFDFSATASEFKSFPAFVSANYPGSQAIQNFGLNVLPRKITSARELDPTAPVFEKPASIPVEIKEGSSYLNYVVEGCRLNGRTLTTQGAPTRDPNKRDGGLTPGPISKLAECEPVGAYGHLIRHEGPVDTWQNSLSAGGDGVKMTRLEGTNRYSLAIPQYKKAQLVSAVSTSGNGKPTNWWNFPLWLVVLLFLAVLLVAYLLLRKKWV